MHYFHSIIYIFNWVKWKSTLPGRLVDANTRLGFVRVIARRRRRWTAISSGYEDVGHIWHQRLAQVLLAMLFAIFCFGFVNTFIPHILHGIIYIFGRWVVGPTDMAKRFYVDAVSIKNSSPQPRKYLGINFPFNNNLLSLNIRCLFATVA